MPLTGPPLAQAFDMANILAVGLRTKPDDLALATNESRWTWRELDESSNRLAANYAALGLKPGDRVASLLPNRGALVVHYLACLKLGAVATPLNYRYQAPEIDHALEVSGARLLVVHAERNADLAASALAGKLPLGRVTFETTDRKFPRLEDLIQSASASAGLAPPPKDAPAFIFFTSGSTGKPKGVTHTHTTFGWMSASAATSFGLKPEDVFLPGSSASHIAATSMIFASLGAGCRVVLARNTDGDEVLSLLRAHRPTLLCFLPAALFGVVRDHNAAHDDFRSVRTCISGGDKVSAELEREFTALTGFAIDEGYGMTETGTATINPVGPANRLGSIGKVCTAYTLAIRDDGGQEVTPETPGRLWVKTPCATIGYWNRPDATAETIVDGWLDTGDLVSADADGYVWFRGRKKQIIIHDGSNICPQEVEESLLDHPAVAAAGVIGIHDTVHGENVRAYVTLKPDVPRPTMTDLIKFSRNSVGYKAPSEIIVLEEMPLNATGKVDRVSLKALAEASLTPASIE